MSAFSDVKKFYEKYKGCKKIIGKSVSGRPIFAFRVGSGCPVGIVQGGIHAREWITSYLVTEQIRFGVARGTVWFLPLVNPDGALLSQCGLSSAEGEWRKELLLSANGRAGNDFRLWKANAAAVDLNVNFDACWGTGEQNVRFPASQGYIGVAPFCEPESKALRDFTLSVCPQYTISYHTQGEEIFWRFHQPFLRCVRDKKIACFLSQKTGYPLKGAGASAGGYKDWCVQKLKIPAFTVEVGKGKHPIGKDQLDTILSQNLSSVNALSTCFYSL